MWSLRCDDGVVKRVDTNLCREVSINIATIFKWVRVSQTLHTALVHSAELIRLNGDCSLGALSEEPSEANNKDIRNMHNNMSRKIDPRLQMKDFLTQQLVHFHHTVREKNLTDTTRNKMHSVCQRQAHSALT